MQLTPDQAKRLAGALFGDEPVDDEGAIDPGGAPKVVAAGGIGDTTGVGWRSAPAPRLTPGPFGHYRITRLIGIGGMGEVYEAQQENPARRVALKIIRPDLVSPELTRRFDHEARVLGRLQHPGIAQSFEAGQVPSSSGPTPFFAMEFVEGQPLTAYAAEHKLSLKQRLELFLKVCEAVEHAHRMGVIHRDLKPGNLLVDDQGRPRVLDFGVARATAADVQATTLHTDVGRLVGTLPYMSPEQVEGDPDALDTRSDVYALGVVLYELLGGRPPYELGKGRVYEAVRVIKETEPAPLSSIDRVFRGDLETIAGKALEKDRERRYQSVGDLAGDVKRYLEDRPIVARRPGVWYQTKKFAARNRVFVLGSSLAMSALVVGAGLASWQALRAIDESTRALAAQRSADESRHLAEQRRVEAERQVEISKAVMTFLNELVSSASPKNGGRDVRVVDVLNRASSKVQSTLSEQPEVAGAVLRTVANMYNELGRFAEAHALMDQALDRLSTVLDPSDPQWLDTRVDLGGILVREGKFTDAETILRSLIGDIATMPRGAKDGLLRGKGLLSLVLMETDRLNDAEALARQVLAAQEEARGNEDRDVLTTKGYLATILERKEQWSESETLLRQLFNVYQSRHEEGSEDAVGLTATLGLVLRHEGRLDEAESALRSALARAEVLFGGEHDRTLTLLNNLAGVLNDKGDRRGALDIFSELVDRQRRSLGPDHPGTAEVLGNYAFLLREDRQLETAESVYREAVAATAKAFGAESPPTLDTMYGWAETLVLLGRFAEARDIYDQLVRGASTREQDPEIFGAIYGIGRGVCLLRLGDLDGAESQLTSSRAVLLRTRGPSNRHTLAASRAMLDLLRIRGNTLAAERLQNEIEQATGRPGTNSP
jgi:tetratricopeptide (TPR) repeat protein/predicted Ser/Thr protein kinase